MASDLYRVWKNGSIKFYDFLTLLSRTQDETHHFFIFLNLYFLKLFQKTFLYFDQVCENTILKLHEFGKFLSFFFEKLTDCD